MKVRVLSFKNSCASAVETKLMADAAAMTMIASRILILLIMTMSPKADHKLFVRNRSTGLLRALFSILLALWPREGERAKTSRRECPSFELRCETADHQRTRE